MLHDAVDDKQHQCHSQREVEDLVFIHVVIGTDTVTNRAVVEQDQKSRDEEADKSQDSLELGEPYYSLDRIGDALVRLGDHLA